jgi:hypothetical protein
MDRDRVQREEEEYIDRAHEDGERVMKEMNGIGGKKLFDIDENMSLNSSQMNSFQESNCSMSFPHIPFSNPISLPSQPAQLIAMSATAPNLRFCEENM